MRRIRINLNKYETLHALLAGRGAPRHLLRSKFALEPTDLTSSTHESVKTVAPSTQLAVFAKTLQNPTRGSYWYAIGAADGDPTAQLCALAIMTRAMDAHVHDPQHNPRPLLHTLYGGRYDKLRDDAGYRNVIGSAGLLVLTNLAANSTPEKIEKARDLLTLFAAVPRVLVVHGMDPLQFCINHLYMKPSRVLYLGGSGRREKQL